LVAVTILRGKREEVVQVLTEELPDDGKLALATEPARKPGIADFGRLGLVVKDLSAEQRKTLSVDKNGVLVTAVQDGPAATAEVREGDVILMIDEHEVHDVSHFETLVAELEAGTSASFYVLRRGNLLLLGFKTD
jgi:serine protease Do